MGDGGQERKGGAERVPATDARNNMGDLLDRVLSGERIAITRNGRPIAALVSTKDLAALAAA